MVFVSYVFVFWFLPCVLVLYYLLPFSARSLFLTLASYVFYGWWRADFAGLMLCTTVVDYLVGAGLGRLADRAREVGPDAGRALHRRRRGLLILSCTANLGLLGYFKYMNFGVDTLSHLCAALGWGPVSWPKVVLPIGISFYTFQSMSYTIDVYRGHVAPVKRFVDFACFVALFPQLVAGPILRYETLQAQLVSRTHTFAKFGTGALFFELGFAKKVLVADTLASVVDNGFLIKAPTFVEAWLATLSYAFQIYFDFSGYSDMAIGLGLMIGFTFPPNFNSPYKAKSVTEFWRRWHISLSTWLRDYLYVPLGGNRRGPRRTYVNLLLTMLLGGLWHGAAWTFVAWGAFHGLWLALERALGKRSLYRRLPTSLQVMATFLGVLFGWVLFRAASLGHAATMAKAMTGLGAIAGLPELQVSQLDAIALLVGPPIAFCAPNSQELATRRSLTLQLFALALFVVALLHLSWSSYRPFLYFRF